MSRYKITIEYDGTPFHGWQRQDGFDTIQQRLEGAIFPIAQARVTMYGSGRTDAGVHALGQVAHFDLAEDFDCFRLQECMNAHLADVPIAVLSIEKTSGDFDSRFSALERTYLYKILNRRSKPAIDINRAWHIVQNLDENKMHSAAQHLVGNHDFSSFRAAGCQSKSPVKTLNSISIRRCADLIFIEVAARSFLYRQVRNIVGSLCLVGGNRWTEQNLIEAFLSKDRTLAGQTAPPYGLYFVGVKY
ncbi:MAG: tRNA pseudouridine(38-40) synthase TruA [Holosporaceae bacterium]|jgi:tRNA pseudouridine38-40 synthase|nr:tRNA pseudouridine(38-40) synthase TruA [Holosporaceae bacterium]